MNSTDPNGLARMSLSSSREDGLVQLSRKTSLREMILFHRLLFYLGRSAENAKRIKSVQDRFVNSHVRWIYSSRSFY